MICYMKKNLTLKDNSEELLTEDSGGLPFVCYYDESRLFTGNHIPWHWHDWVELNYVDSGILKMYTTDEEVEAHPGDVIFINRNTMHAYDFPDQVNYYSFIFDARFLAGEFGGYIDRKYFAPILRSKNLPALHLKSDSARRIHMIGSILKAIDQIREEPAGYEFAVREILSRFSCSCRKRPRRSAPLKRRGMSATWSA